MKAPKTLHPEQWLFAAAIDWLLIVASFLAIAYFDWISVWVLAFVVIGNRQNALHALGHDGVHYTVCRNKALNDWLTCLICFWPLWTPMQGFRTFHLRHHKYLGTVNDPEYEMKGNEPAGEPEVTTGRILLWTLRDVCGGGALSMSKFMRKYNQGISGPILFWAAALLIAVCAGCLWPLLVWNLAFLSLFTTGFKALGYKQHWGTTDTIEFRPNWWQRIFFPHNIWAHREHHQWPSIPFYDLGS